MDTLEKNIRIKFMRLTDSAPTWAEFNTDKSGNFFSELRPTIRIKTSALKPLRAIRGMDQHGVPLTFEHLFRAPRS